MLDYGFDSDGDDYVESLRELHKLAREVKGSTPADSPLRAASLELNAALAAGVDAGVPQAELARMLGVDENAVTQRLRRYAAGNEYVEHPREREPSTHCGNGHLLDEENLRVEPSGNRVCRTCERARRKRYEEKRDTVGRSIWPHNINA